MPGALRTDLYELNMAVSYLRRDMTGSATFSLFVRGVPKQRGFLVAAGLERCLDHLEGFSFAQEDLAYLGSIGFDERALEDLAPLRFDGDVWAMPEGTIVHGGEPIMEVSASIPVAQLVESFLLNQVTLHTTIASKAARYVIAADGKGLVDFALRRTHGVEAAAAVARVSAIVGFAATSNVDAARQLGLPVAGTMAHSFVEAFDSEEEAFRAFAKDHPARTTFLVDTYDTPNGVRNAIAIARELGISDGIGVRLDSGNLDQLAREARAILDEAGFPNARIFASGGLDEHEVAELVRGGAPVDAFGIGTQLGVSADAPYVDTVYKLVEYDGRPAMKLSAAKATAPGPKQVWRHEGEDDVLALRDEAEPGPGWRHLLEPVMRDGRRLQPDPSIARMRERFRSDLERLPAKAKRLAHAEHVGVRHSDALTALTRETTEDALLRAGIRERRGSD
ncbi:MAG TPA: nicotinate phosphoribosyltransferase [Actinomycetota bacterium]|nr:nicotinate phosphoribosyltransferase [Actinomycetota bacterium]